MYNRLRIMPLEAVATLERSHLTSAATTALTLCSHAAAMPPGTWLGTSRLACRVSIWVLVFASNARSEPRLTGGAAPGADLCSSPRSDAWAGLAGLCGESDASLKGVRAMLAVSFCATGPGVNVFGHSVARRCMPLVPQVPRLPLPSARPQLRRPRRLYKCSTLFEVKECSQVPHTCPADHTLFNRGVSTDRSNSQHSSVQT